MDNTNVETPLEYQVFSLSLSQEGAIRYFAEHLPVGVLDGKGHAEFYKAMLDYHRVTGQDSIDATAFKAWLESETKIYDALGGAEGVQAYIELVGKTEPSTPEAVTGILRYRHNREKQIESVKSLNELVQEKHRGEDVLSAIDELAEEVRSLNHSVSDPLKTVVDGQRIALGAEDLWDLPHFLPTPFRSLNRAMGYDPDNSGFCKGAVHAILAGSGKGKSTLAKCFMNHWVDNGNTVLFVNFEEAKEHWERILFTQVTGKNVYLASEVPDIERKHYNRIFQEKLKEWDGRFLVKHDPDTPYFEDLEAWIRAIAHHREVPDVIIIDTLQSMFLREGRGLPRWGQYEQMMVRLEKLAKDLHSVVIITSQENSNRMKEKREVVQQSDIGGSLAIAQKSSITIFITDAKTELGDDTMDEQIMQLQIPKNRITGISFMMDPPLVRYDDSTKTYSEFELNSLERYDVAVDSNIEELY